MMRLQQEITAGGFDGAAVDHGYRSLITTYTGVTGAGWEIERMGAAPCKPCVTIGARRRGLFGIGS